VELKNRLGGEPHIHCSGLGGPMWTPPYADQVVEDHDEIQIGSIRLRAIHTPGHTPEHLAWAVFDETRSKDTPWLLLTGDFVFVGDVGRPDLLGEKEKASLARQLYASVMNILPHYADFTEVFPGHGAGSLCGKAIGSRASSTLGYERRFSASLQPADEPAWIERLLAGMPLAPPYFARMKQVNRTGPALIGPELPGRARLSAPQVHKQVSEQCLILDVRSKEAFAASHIAGSINIPEGPNLPTWAGWVLPYDKPILLVADRAEVVDDAVRHLLRVGFDQVRGYMEGGMDAWQMHGYPIHTLRTLSVHDLAAKIRTEKDRLQILDVRTEGEWNAGHIDGAIHIHGGLLQSRSVELEYDRPTLVVCGSGYRASIAASFLQRQGFSDVANVLGGMTAWKAAELPTVK
jgi:hydroxyacylglutathione hydrolase